MTTMRRGQESRAVWIAINQKWRQQIQSGNDRIRRLPEWILALSCWKIPNSCTQILAWLHFCCWRKGCDLSNVISNCLQHCDKMGMKMLCSLSRIHENTAGTHLLSKLQYTAVVSRYPSRKGIGNIWKCSFMVTASFRLYIHQSRKHIIGCISRTKKVTSGA